MLQIENECETPIESNYDQNKKNHSQNHNNIQEITDILSKNLKEVQAQSKYIRKHQIKKNKQKKILDNPTSLGKSKK